MRNPETIGVVPSPLGIYAKYITPPLPAAAAKSIVQGLRVERYALLAQARRLFSEAGKAEGLQFGHDFHRTAKCKHIRRGGENVGVHLDKKHASAFYSSLVTCGSVWACPICAAKIQERRREEIAKAVQWAYAQGLQPVLVTLTSPHYSHQKIGDLLAMQAMALQRLRAGQPWEKFKKREGFRGLIRSLETTHGVNGWHIHTHELWFLKASADAGQLRGEISSRWASACARAGLLDIKNDSQVLAFMAHAVDVKGNCSASDYLAKQDDSRHWGVDRELAKGSTKAGKLKGAHPFGLLKQAATDRRSGELFVAYAVAMRGKRQIFWSHGLKKQVGIGEVTDEALAEEQREEADLLGLLDADDWKTVREAGQRGQLLTAAEGGGWPAVQALLDRLTRDEIRRLEALLSLPAPPRCSEAPQGPGGPPEGPRRAPTLLAKY